MVKFYISGEIEAKDEEEARFKATIEGGCGILKFKDSNSVDGEIYWDEKGKPLFCIIPMELNVFDYLSIDQETGVVTIDGRVDNSSSEKLVISEGKIVEVI